MKKIKIERQYRNLNINSGDIDEENRTVDLSFSSEIPVSRWFGGEILDHNSKSVDLSRLNNGAAVLEDHQGAQIGVVEAANIKNSKGLAKLRFSKNGRGAEVFEDIVDGIRRNISFGYELRNLTLESDGEDKDPVYRSTDWMPFEISVVGVPADHSIGIGRSKEDEPNEIEVDDSFRDFTKKDIEEIIEEKEVEFVPNKLREKEMSLAEAKLKVTQLKNRSIK